MVFPCAEFGTSGNFELNCINPQDLLFVHGLFWGQTHNRLKVVIAVHDAYVKATRVGIRNAKRGSLWFGHAVAQKASHFGQSPPLSVHIVLYHQRARTKLVWLQDVKPSAASLVGLKIGSPLPFPSLTHDSCGCLRKKADNECRTTLQQFLQQE